MPSWKTHILLNLIIFIFWVKLLFLIYPSIDIRYLFILLPLVIFVSIFPDIDTKRSKIREWISLVLATCIVILFLIIRVTEIWYNIPISFLVLYFSLKYLPTRHRTLTHTLLFSFIFSLILTWIFWIFFAPTIGILFLTFLILFISYNSHLFFDWLF